MTSRGTTLIALTGVMAWLVIAAITWWVSAPLGHDESQYAIAARDLLGGGEPRWFYVSRGMSYVAAPGIWLGSSERALRLIPLLIGVGFAGATWLLARRVVGDRAAGWAVIVPAAARPITRFCCDLLSDIPSAACLLAALAMIAGELDRPEGARWRIVIVAPLFAAAFYTRYGSAIPIAVIVCASVLVGGRTLVRRPLPVVVAAALFLLLLVPHFLEAQALVGSPLGILRLSREVPHHERFADGLITYVTSAPFHYYGLFTPFALAAGMFSLRIRDRKRLLAWLVGVGTFIAMGLVTHGMLRYILFPVVILAALGADQILRWLDLVPNHIRRIIGVGIVAVLAYSWVMTVAKQPRLEDGRRTSMRGTLLAAQAIRSDAAGAPCMVLGYNSTQVEWYSRCFVPLIMDTPDAAIEAHAKGRRVYAVRDYTGKPIWQPDFAQLPGKPSAILVVPGLVEVVRMVP